MPRARKNRGNLSATEEKLCSSDTIAIEAESGTLEALRVGKEEELALAVHEETLAISVEVVTDQILTPKEREQLFVLEREVEQGFQIAGRALREIHERKLYREQFGTFEAYCESRFGLKRRHPYYLMTASIVVDNLRARGVHIMPTGEYQIRPLAQVKEPEKQVEDWTHALEKSGGRLPTYKQVLEAVAEIIGSPPAQGKLVLSFSEGDVCVVKRTSDTLLSDRKGFWGIVDEVQGDTITVSLYDRTVDGVRAVDLEKLALDKKQKERRAKILRSLKEIHDTLATSEKAVVALLEHLGRKRTPLTPFEHGLLGYLEQQAKESGGTSAVESSSST